MRFRVEQCPGDCIKWFVGGQVRLETPMKMEKADFAYRGLVFKLKPEREFAIRTAAVDIGGTMHSHVVAFFQKQ